jgi:tetratricopeptide (TPR) repeat protein
MFMKSSGTGRPFRGLSLAIALCAAAGAFGLALGGCSGGRSLASAMRPKTVSATDKSSLGVDQLKEAIAGYATEAERRKFGDAAKLGLDASVNLGKYRLELADRYMGMRMFKDAYDLLVLAVQSFPDDSRIYYNAGMAAAYIAKAADIKGPAGKAEQDRWFATAESSYRRSISINPRSIQALYGCAVLYAFELGRAGEAVPLLTSLLGMETKNVDAMMLLARCYAELGRAEEAANWYETAAKTTVVPEKRKIAEENRAKLLADLEGKKNGK